MGRCLERTNESVLEKLPLDAPSLSPPSPLSLPELSFSPRSLPALSPSACSRSGAVVPHHYASSRQPVGLLPLRRRRPAVLCILSTARPSLPDLSFSPRSLPALSPSACSPSGVVVPHRCVSLSLPPSSPALSLSSLPSPLLRSSCPPIFLSPRDPLSLCLPPPPAPRIADLPLSLPLSLLPLALPISLSLSPSLSLDLSLSGRRPGVGFATLNPTAPAPLRPIALPLFLSLSLSRPSLILSRRPGEVSCSLPPSALTPLCPPRTPNLPCSAGRCIQGIIC